MAQYPLIGVTGPQRGGLAAWWASWLVIRLCGGRAVRITSRTAHYPKLDGMIIGGGSDISPELYGDYTSVSEKITLPTMSLATTFATWLFAPLFFVLRLIFSTKNPRRADEERDAMESALIRQALHAGIPLLGICRGAQLLNVTCGGSLLRDLSSFYTEVPHMRTILPRKRIRPHPGTRLALYLGTEPVLVNALHDQAIDRTGQNIRISARDENGIVQAIEHGEHPFAIGVQWHPEYLYYRDQQRALFRQLIQAAQEAQHKETSCKTG